MSRIVKIVATLLVSLQITMITLCDTTLFFPVDR